MSWAVALVPTTDRAATKAAVQAIITANQPTNGNVNVLLSASSQLVISGTGPAQPVPDVTVETVELSTLTGDLTSYITMLAAYDTNGYTVQQEIPIQFTSAHHEDSGYLILVIKPSPVLGSGIQFVNLYDLEIDSAAVGINTSFSFSWDFPTDFPTIPAGAKYVAWRQLIEVGNGHQSITTAGQFTISIDASVHFRNFTQFTTTLVDTDIMWVTYDYLTPYSGAYQFDWPVTAPPVGTYDIATTISALGYWI